MLEGFPNAHLWSIGATEGTQSIRLDTLDEGQTRLLACPPASPSRPGALRIHYVEGRLSSNVCIIKWALCVECMPLTHKGSLASIVWSKG